MFKLNNEETFFIHVPRTGGASVYHAISEAKLCKSFGNVHSTINYLKGQGYEGKTYLIQVRNPFDRLYSTFCHFKKFNFKFISTFKPSYLFSKMKILLWKI